MADVVELALRVGCGKKARAATIPDIQEVHTSDIQVAYKQHTSRIPLTYNYM